MAAIIHVKLTGEGDFGPVDLECAIPPARLPVVMAALFGQPMYGPGGSLSGGMSGNGASQHGGTHPARLHVPRQDSEHTGREPFGGVTPAGAGNDRAGSGSGSSVVGGEVLQNAAGSAYAADPVGGVDPGAFITSFLGSLGDLIGRMQPRGFAETILVAAIWLHYRDGRGFITRDDIRRVLRRQEHVRMPRNFSRDFHVALSRGYLEPVENEDGYVVSGAGYQWFRLECRK
ncbi:hypothetical protein ACQ0MK_05780 [Thalassospira lucentensis]|uniref:hypothetical protein n=1 Tax=Thalassospira lucentensis TaxID=168935 RepID=UPI003D2EB6B3